MTTTMSDYHFEAEISGSLTIDAKALRERAYRAAAGVVRVRAQWPRPSEEPSLRMPLQVIDESASLDARDVPAYVELFLHDAFLILNLAQPGSFSGVIATSGGEYRVRELTLDASIFTYAKARPLPLDDVAAWFESLPLGTEQIATTDIAKALFHLLHIARGAEPELRLTFALEALFDDAPARAPRLFELRDSILRGDAPVVHPMEDDALDPRIEDVDWTEAIDEAAAAVIAELQSRVR
jgi:hypothetical protein